MRLAVLLGVLVGVGCVPPPVYRVQRTARVPRPAAPLRTGEPLAGPVELSIGASSIGDVRKPQLADEQASLEVPREQIRGELRIRIKRGEIAPIYEQAVASSMQPLDPTQAAVERGSPTGFGLATRYSFETGAPGLSFGVGLEMMSWRIPYVEYRTCVMYCEENGVATQQINYGYESVGTLGLGLTPTYRSGDLAIFAGAYTRRHPTIVRKGTELYAMDYDQDVDGGNYNWLLHAGVEYRLPVISVLATVQQNVTRDPVWYGPSFGFALAFRVPELAPRPAPPREPPPPPRIIGDYDADLPDDPW